MIAYIEGSDIKNLRFVLKSINLFMLQILFEIFVVLYNRIGNKLEFNRV